MGTNLPFLWRTFVRPVRADVRNHDSAALTCSACESRGATREVRPGWQPDRQPNTATRADRLERISVYARAGYFDMSHCVDTYPWHGEIGPD